MARGVITIDTPLSATEAFAFMSDMRLYASWDPGIVRAVQVVGTGPGPDAEVDLVFAGVGPSRTLRYRVLDYSPPRSMRIGADSRWLRSRDQLTVAPSDDGSTVTYEAELTLRGGFATVDPVLAAVFRSYAGMVGRGLRDALRGELR